MPLDSCSSASGLARKPKLLVVECWGLGDLVFSTTILGAALEHYDVTLVGKPHARSLLEPTFPEIKFIPWDPPWSAYRHKYRLHRWPWREIARLIGRLRSEHFDAAISVRHDPRDHLLMRLAGAAARHGFGTTGSGLFLTDRLQRPAKKQHRVEDWRHVGRSLGLGNMEGAVPTLRHPEYHSTATDRLLGNVQKPVICLHPGARISTRRWPEPSFAHVIEKMREHYDFHLVLVPDPDGYGSALASLAETILPNPAIRELVDLLGRVDLLFCNDSGPAHIAAACGKPVIPVFGPSDPDWFHPWGYRNHVVIRDICPWRPCFDYCKFDQPHCLTKLSPEIVWREVQGHMEKLISGGILSSTLRKPAVAGGHPA